MDRQLDMRLERRIRMWILDQELERRKATPAPTSPPQQRHAH